MLTVHAIASFGGVAASPSSLMWVGTEGIEVTGFVWGGGSK